MKHFYPRPQVFHFETFGEQAKMSNKKERNANQMDENVFLEEKRILKDTNIKKPKFEEIKLFSRKISSYNSFNCSSLISSAKISSNSWLISNNLTNLKNTIEQITEEEKIMEDALSNADMNYDMENLAKGQVLQMYVDKLESIKKLKNNPYFARMDFKENNKNKEVFYIGKLSVLDSKTLEPIVVDWRAPISNLYYEGKIGKASYEVLSDKIDGEISLKRQYVIENQVLKKYVDINVTGNDELLQNALEEKADDRLKNIVATIQDEQNKIIRASINAPVIVQGVAGSRENNNSASQNCILNI